MSWTFFREFVRNWKVTGAIAPSSRSLARQVVQAAGVPHAKTVLELGPGTGAFTAMISEVRQSDARYLGIEMNPTFVAELRERFGGMQFETAAAQEFDYDSFLGTGGMFDAIVSGLPWTAFPEGLQVAILEKVLPRLRTGAR